MRHPLRSYVYFGAILSMAPSSYAQDFYVVKHGDVLSRIAHRTFGYPIYSKNGSYPKILSLNPGIKNPNKILIGQKIRISDSPEYLEESTLSKNTKGNERQLSLESDDIKPNNEDIKIKEDGPIDAAVESSFERTSGLEFRPEFGFLKIDTKSTDTSASAKLLSSSHFYVPIALVQHWSKDISSYERFSFARSSFEEPKDGTFLKKTSISQYGFGIGVRFFESYRNRLSTELAMDQKIIARATSGDTFTLDSVTVPNLKVRTEHELYNFNPFKFGFSLLGNAWAPSTQSNYNTKFGFTYGAGFYLAQKFESSNVSVGMHYLRSEEDTSISNQSKTELGFGLQYSLNFESHKK